ncbi:putative phosphatase regulatory subunit-domain-containing protein [Mycena vulgaris]|nr:putative phosphatase regulatory subunit-domain-containing protein [Mycena vulgaris]
MDFRNSNTAGAPLPIIPRRSPSANRASHPFPSTSSTPPKASPIKLTVQKATPPDDKAEGSSSSSSDSRPTVSIRAKRVRGVRPPEQSTPTPAVFLARQQPPPPPAVDAEDGDTTPRPTTRALFYTPGTTAGPGLRALSTSHLPVLSPSPSLPKHADETPRMVRKKSGQPVKSSLKSSAPRLRGSLAVVIGAGSSKSAPTTPTHGTRSVHFDTQEHIKLFLAEQKPLAVSRDGSPTEDTSGTDGDFPDWIFGREGAGRLEMDVVVPPAQGEVDVKLQALSLADDGTSVTGQVAVRNLAFDKWVAVRFTFDDWQTTSEVTARYSHSLPGGAVDVFSFSIRLTDLLARIEGKEMVLAVRYTSAGREMWDNNGGPNYRATFKRVRGETRKEVEEAKPKPEGEVIADLRSRLERVVKGQEGPGPLQLRAGKASTESADKFKAGGSLAARYDFGTSLRNPWRPTASVHQRAKSHPVLDSPSPPSTIPWPSVPKVALKARVALGSPRDAGEDAFRPAPYVTSDNEDPVFATPPAVARNHQRGYFDLPLRDAAALRRTPPGTPRRALDDLTPLSSPGRFNSYPPLDPRLGMGLELDGRLTPRGVARELSASEVSTPGMVSSPGSSASGSASPVSPLDYVGLGMVMQASASPATYHTFLDKFCFYTGPEVEGLPAHAVRLECGGVFIHRVCVAAPAYVHAEAARAYAAALRRRRDDAHRHFHAPFSGDPLLLPHKTLHSILFHFILHFRFSVGGFFFRRTKLGLSLCLSLSSLVHATDFHCTTIPWTRPIRPHPIHIISALGPLSIPTQLVPLPCTFNLRTIIYGLKIYLPTHTYSHKTA